MTEDFLHYVWQHQLLAGGLTTTDGQPVVVLRAGDHNQDAGPDFFNARVRIGDIEWSGNVEIHVKSSAWNAHRHSHDAAYNNVILHVVYEHDCEIKLQNGKVPPTLEVSHWLHPSLVANYDALTAPQSSASLPCGKHVSEVPHFVIGTFLERLMVERLEAKSAVVRRMLEESHGGWEDVCYWLIARYFGGKINALAFELLAKATDQRFLARWKDAPQRVEAILMGQAGLLDGYFEDDYPRTLQADYGALRTGAGLEPIGGYLWKFYRLRPSSFPTIRISQFAHLISESANLFATLLPMTDAASVVKHFCQSASSYWDSHYQFDKVSRTASSKRIGRTQAETIVINAWIPLLFVYGSAHGQQHYKDQALDLLSQLPAEDNAVIRRWRKDGIDAANAAESQALLQLDSSYCQRRDCLACRIGFNILKRT